MSLECDSMRAPAMSLKSVNRFVGPVLLRSSHRLNGVVRAGRRQVVNHTPTRDEANGVSMSCSSSLFRE
ncbi:hypothetical protein PAXRUDRAFT_835458 [Paxillus rubicundulus Ve08.2h10]|uniref:Uncharacterized protein n=1 Tax=Paxillus rubicundulus Ve08.2h10 TaxID=930991 RepID=A0A0D0CLG0_9AGAM|nr:hypothetical protein PAXRUDRAFT_835458 [Paxillus rubicundulus Ve08.2h10]